MRDCRHPLRRGSPLRRSPRAWRDGAPVRTDLEQFIAGLEGLPDAGAGLAQRLGAIGFAAMGGIGQRGPIERDEGAPGEIVEVGIGVGLDRGRILDAVGRNDRRAILRRPGGEKRDQSCESDAEENPRVANLILRSEAKLRVSKDAPEVRRRIGRALKQVLRGPFGAPQDEGRLKCKGNTSAAFPAAPHSHSGPSVYAIGLAGQGGAQGEGIIPQDVLLFAGCVSAPDSAIIEPACSRSLTGPPPAL